MFAEQLIYGLPQICVANFRNDGYLPISHLNPNESITPFLPPFLIIACPKPVNLSPHLRCKPTPYSMYGSILISGIVTSCNEKCVLSMIFHLIFTAIYGCQPFFKFAINLTPGATCIAFKGDEPTWLPRPLSCANVWINEYEISKLGCTINLPFLN